MKDHKPGWPGKKDARLLNPAKSELGVIVKVKLQGINATIRGATGLLQWRKTKDTILWFEGLTSEASTSNLKFFKFDFEAFYPSIKPDLFLKAIAWGKKFHPNFQGQQGANAACMQFIFIL